MAIFSMVPLPPPVPRRLLRSLVGLKQVIINAAHYLVLGDKEAYHFDPEAPFLQMVSPLLHLLRAPSGVCGPIQEQWCEGVALLFLPCPGVKDLCPGKLVVHLRDR